jgi:putative SOS response-associated peptidase YedK
VPAEWFYEWAQVDSKTKQPYGIGLKDGSMFAFAGLWDRWPTKLQVRSWRPTPFLQRSQTRLPLQSTTECR